MLIDKINELQKKAKGNEIFVAEQIKDIAQGVSAVQQKLMLEDFKDNTLTEIENLIAEYAKQHKTGGCGCCPPKVAEDIIKNYFGLKDTNEHKKINLIDFM